MFPFVKLSMCEAFTMRRTENVHENGGAKGKLSLDASEEGCAQNEICARE